MKMNEVKRSEIPISLRIGKIKIVEGKLFRLDFR